jgi:hypothetical protein
MTDTQSLLFANEIFYQVFSDGNLEGMQKLWLKSDDIVCIHPGWTALRGYEDVVASWAAILGSPDLSSIQPVKAVGRVLGKVGLVVCYEKLGEGHLVATNVFLFEGGKWQIIHHQAGPTSGELGEHDLTEEIAQLH